jgi:ketosteroid isomerase-like protein
MPDQPDPVTVVLRFNDCITAGDVDSLADLMTSDHCFVDTEGLAVVGRDACRAAWVGFFAAFPDYRNVFTVVRAGPAAVSVRGHSICAAPELAGPALWAAAVRDGRIARWQVFQDTAANRALLGLPDDLDG